MNSPELTDLQIKELQKKYRYIRFVHRDIFDKAILPDYDLQVTDEKKKVWTTIEAPIVGQKISSIKFYENQVIDLQEY